MIRLSQAAKELNVGITTISEHLAAQGVKDLKTNSKITHEQFVTLAKELGIDLPEKKPARTQKKTEKAEVKANTKTETKEEKVDKPTPEKSSEEEVISKIEENKLQGTKVLRTIDLDEIEKPKKKRIKSKTEEKDNNTKAKKSNRNNRRRNKKNNNTNTEENKTNNSDANKSETANKEKVVNNKSETKQTDTKKEKEQKNAETKNSEQEVENQEEKNMELIKAKAETLSGLTVLRKIDLPEKKKKTKSKPLASSDASGRTNNRKSRRSRNNRNSSKQGSNNKSNTQNNNNNKEGNNNNRTNNNRGNNSNNNNSSNNNNNRNNNSRNRSRNSSNSNSGGNNRRNRSRNNRGNNNRNANEKEEITAKQIQDQLKATLAKMNKSVKSGGRRKDRDRNKNKNQEEFKEQDNTKKITVTEYVAVSDFANIMEVSVNNVIEVCMNLGMLVSINQRLDAETITVVADEFGFEVEFSGVEVEDTLDQLEEEDAEADLKERPPIVTIMGHVDHGKTSLLDYIRNTNVIAQESGGITQHIGAYDVETEGGKRITFLDTPGHEAFTAMRARGAKVTDIVILVVAADDKVMPQTKEAIDHAKVAGVPIVIAINKVDKPAANPDKIREELSAENVLVEAWGGKYQDQEISAKTGQGIEDLLEKVLIEAELLELQANADKNAKGTVIEALLDKGKGYVATVLVQEGTLKIGDMVLAGANHGRVKAMNDHIGKRLGEAGPAKPIQILGLNGAPQSGDVFRVLDNEKQAKDIANKREQILREQSFRAKPVLTLEEIGRRRALGEFQELKIIVKGDVDGSVEALSDSLMKLSTEEIEVKIIHKAVGQISEADIMLAKASDAVIVGFQVRPSANARRSAEQEQVQIKLYSIIYAAIDEIRDAMEGMLSPEIKEETTGYAEVRDIFKISKVGTIAGCYITDGFIKRNNPIRLIRDGIVIYGGENSGEIDSLKRFKEDANEVKSGYECGISIKNYNDIKVGDVIESYQEVETKRTL